MRDRSEVEYKELEKELLATIRFDMLDRNEIYPVLEKIKEEAGDYVCGPPFIIYHWGTGVDNGYDVEVGYPVLEEIYSDEIETYELEDVDVISHTHYGDYDDVRGSYQKISKYMKEHGLIPMPQSRQILIKEDPDDPDDNVMEIQLFIHNWDDRLEEGLDEILGEEERNIIMKGTENINFDSSWEERFDWIVSTMKRLEERTDELQRYQIVSCCADHFSERRIEGLRDIYLKKHDIDEVLEAMVEDPGWYEKPVREGNTIYSRKNPYDKEGYENAENDDERKKAYCHCGMIRDRLEEVPSSYCYCGSGWYRQIWEGITGKPVRIELLKSLTNGDDECSFAIHLNLQ